MEADHKFIKLYQSTSENFCKNILHDFLMKHLPNSTISWVQEGDPPDYYLFIDGTQYAVEITIIVETLDVGVKNPLPMGKIQDELKKFIQEVESVAHHEGYLRGLYHVTFLKPICKFTAVKTIIRDKLITYLRNTQNLSNAPSEIIYESDSQICEIKKVRGENNRILMSGPGDSKFGSQLLANARNLLNERIQTKERKLNKFPYPKVLILHNKDILCTAEIYKSSISLVPSRN